MARALIGYVGGPTAAQTREVAQLRQRVRDLEAEVGRLKAENDALESALSNRVAHISTADLLEPVTS